MSSLHEVLLDHEITDAISFFACGMFNYTESERSLAPTPGFFVVGGANANNPFPGETVGVVYRLLELGPRIDEFETYSHNVIAGFNGTYRDWDLELGFGTGHIETTSRGVSGYATETAVQSAIDNGVLNPFGAGPAFNPGSVHFQTERKGVSKLYLIDFKANGELFELSFGTLAVAIGGEYRKEDFSDNFDPTTASGAVLRIGGTSADGNRDIYSGFLEFEIPILGDLEISAISKHFKPIY